MLSFYHLPQALQLDLSELSNQFIRFKIYVEERLSNISTENALFNSQGETNKQVLRQFCVKFEESLKNLENNLALIFRNSNEGLIKQEHTDQRISQLSEKIADLERSLIKTQQNQSRLIVTLNKMMEQNSLTHNNAINQQKINQYLPTRVPLHISKGQREANDIFRETVKYEQKNIYLNKELTQLSRQQNNQYIRTFSKGQQGSKRSLKVNASYDRFAQDQERHSNSREKHNYEHRLKFMMHHLNG